MMHAAELYTRRDDTMAQDYRIAGVIVTCILMSGFFSGSETAVTAVNRYRLHFLSKTKKDPKAVVLSALLSRPQRLLGMILIANTFLNILVSSLATTVTMNTLGEDYVLISTVVLTLLVLIFAEVLPKSIAALQADVLAYQVAYVLRGLLWLFSPLVSVVDAITTLIMRCMGMKVHQEKEMHLSRDELGNLIKLKRKSAPLEQDVEHMLEGVLDLEQVTVEEIMLPRNQVHAIDINDAWRDVVSALKQCNKAHVVIMDADIDHLIGYVDMHVIMCCLLDSKLSKEVLLKKIRKFSYVPLTTKCEKQLQHFKGSGESIAAVVDEYGQVCGLVERNDIVDEIIGEYVAGYSQQWGPFLRKEQGYYWFRGDTAVRDINKALHWELPEEHANTIGGLVLDCLECIPEGPLSLEIERYRVELLQIKNNKVLLLKIQPPEGHDITGYSANENGRGG